MKKKPTRNSPASQSAPSGNSPLQAAPPGTTIRTTIERGDAYLSPQLYNVEITLLESLRGSDAAELLKAQRLSDKPPVEGFEYILARIRLGYFRRARGLEDEQYTLAEGQISAVSSDGKTEYTLPSDLRQPQPQMINAVFNPDDRREGWILLQVAKDEKKPLLVYKRKHLEGIYGIWGGIWFQLY